MRGEMRMSMDPKIIKGEYLNSAYSELANLIGIDAVLKIHATYRGQQVFFPVDLFSKDRRVSAYIDEMLRTPRGSYYVRTWDEDLKNLKHYRWVRNQISHEPGCTEQNMCEPEDELWLDEFYSRIMNQTDPLSLYHQATRPRPVSKPVARPIQSTTTYTQPSNYRKPARNNVGCATMVIVSLLVVAGIILLTQFI